MRDSLLLLLTLFHMQAFSQFKSENWQLFDTQDLIAQQEQSQNIYLRFLDNANISAGIYALKAGDQDNQSPHLKDEIYFILSGQSDFKVEDETTSVTPGDVLFVRASLEHEFINIQEDLKILVWFSGSTNTDHNFNWKKWTMKELASDGDPNENIWNDFIKIPTMTAGLYQLPQKLGGDSALTHHVDEINYVVKGKAKFQMGGDVKEMYPGSIMWVKAGTGHRFFDLTENFEVYIMFAKQ